MSRKRKKTPFKVWENPKEYDGYIRLAYDLIDNEVFRGLSGNAFKLYVYMREGAYKNEKSNGQYLTYSLSLAKKALGVSEPTANKALLELENKKIIKRLNNSRWAREQVNGSSLMSGIKRNEIWHILYSPKIFGYEISLLIFSKKSLVVFL